MKARVRATGDTYNVIDMNDYRNRFKLEDNNWYTMGEVELIEGSEPDWQQYRIQAAISAMEGLLLGSWEVEEDDEHDKVAIIAKWSVQLADTLIAELQKKQL